MRLESSVSLPWKVLKVLSLISDWQSELLRRCQLTASYLPVNSCFGGQWEDYGPGSTHLERVGVGHILLYPLSTWLVQFYPMFRSFINYPDFQPKSLEFVA